MLSVKNSLVGSGLFLVEGSNLFEIGSGKLISFSGAFITEIQPF
jgi:hypothetical protein